MLEDKQFMFYLFEHNMFFRNYVIFLGSSIDDIVDTRLTINHYFNLEHESRSPTITKKAYNLELRDSMNQVHKFFVCLDLSRDYFTLIILRNPIVIDEGIMTDILMIGNTIDSLNENKFILYDDLRGRWKVKDECPEELKGVKCHIYYTYIQLKYFNEDILNHNLNHDFYQLSYLLKYGKKHDEDNRLVNNIIDTYEKYEKEYVEC